MTETMPRSDHALAMDRMYRYTRHVYDLTRKPYLLGRDRMIAGLEVPRGGTVLELGCGTGRNLISVARRYPDCELHGVDISEAMLRTARANVERAGLQNRIRLAEGDATAFDADRTFGRRDFDRVYFSYSLSMIPDWERALVEGLRLVGRDGRLSVVDFGDGSGLGPGRSVLHAWLSLFHVTPRTGLAEAVGRLASATGRIADHADHARGYAQIAGLR